MNKKESKLCISKLLFRIGMQEIRSTFLVEDGIALTCVMIMVINNENPNDHDRIPGSSSNGREWTLKWQCVKSSVQVDGTTTVCHSNLILLTYTNILLSGKKK